MLAAVSTSALNVRTLPSTSSAVLGVLRQWEVVDTTDIENTWLEVHFGGIRGYIAKHYVQCPVSSCAVVGVVNADLLNVRDKPTTGSKIAGTLSGGTVVSLLGHLPHWLEVEFNGELAYIAAEYVRLYAKTPAYTAKVRAEKLNIRAQPKMTSPVIGCLNWDQAVRVDTNVGQWAQFVFNGAVAYAAKRYLASNDTELKEPPSAAPEDNEAFPPEISGPAEPDDVLGPVQQLPLTDNETERQVSLTWNKYGGELNRLSRDLGLDVACTVAVLCVESAGKGFEQNNHNRMIIRFENHKFWRYWGRYHAQQFGNHFQFDSHSSWKKHRWRASSDVDWQSFHGHQKQEWQVFEFAKSIDSTAAMLSISMGAPQIMGFNFQRIGYASVEDMFDAFSAGIDEQIRGLFAFMDDAMLHYLNELEFVSFAARYNGSGQKEYYGGLIAEHYKSFKELTRGVTPA